MVGNFNPHCVLHAHVCIIGGLVSMKLIFAIICSLGIIKLHNEMFNCAAKKDICYTIAYAAALIFATILMVNMV